MNWIVPELGTDFTEDFEDMLVPYLHTKYSITDPMKGSQPHSNVETEPETVSFRPGFPDFNRPYEICVIQMKTTPIEKIGWKYTFTTDLDILVRMQRLNRDAIEMDFQLENMEQEIVRIIEGYYWNDIVGIKEIFFDPVSTERVYNAIDTWAKSDWRSIVRAKMFYEKENLE